MKRLCVNLAVIILRFVNVFFKPLKLKKKVAIISRQSDTPTMDIEMLDSALKEKGIETVVLCKKLEKSISGGLSYCVMMMRQMHQIATSRVVVIDGYCILVSILPKKKGQSVVQMWHALGAIKKFGWQSVENPDGHSKDVAEAMKMHRNYDHVLAPCKETGRYFAEGFRTPEDRLVYLGLPRIDFIRTPDEDKKAAIFEKYPKAAEKTNVLYVPTFRKNAVLGMEKLVHGFDFESMNLIIKKHFLDKGDYTWAEEAGAIVDMEFSSLDWMKISEKVVTDYSAISFEAAAIDRQLYIYQPDVEKYAANNGLNVDMHKEAIKDYVCETEEELFEALKNPYDMEAIYAFRDKFLDIELDDCTGRLCDFVISLL